MHYKTASILALASVLCTASAQSSGDGHLMVATSWIGSGCTGTSDLLYTDVSTTYCFNTGGNAYSDVGWNDGTCAGGMEVITWSGANCEGSSFATLLMGNPDIVDGQGSGPVPGYENPNNTCVGVPYASIWLGCTY